MADAKEKTIEEQRHEALTAEIAKKKKEIKERKETELKDGFLNPLGEGTSYAEFQKAVANSKKTVAEYCKGKLDKATIEWIEGEIKQIKE